MKWLVVEWSRMEWNGMDAVWSTVYGHGVSTKGEEGQEGSRYAGEAKRPTMFRLFAAGPKTVSVFVLLSIFKVTFLWLSSSRTTKRKIYIFPYRFVVVGLKQLNAAPAIDDNFDSNYKYGKVIIKTLRDSQHFESPQYSKHFSHKDYHKTLHPPPHNPHRINYGMVQDGNTGEYATKSTLQIRRGGRTFAEWQKDAER